jgi:His/Glu/Gln/Arg/opine family amino acid ABC transporter permease subunit
MLDLLRHFLPDFFAGLVVNLGIAAVAVAGGLVLGLPLAGARWMGGAPARVAAWLVAPLRAAPTFVVMFFLLHALPARLSLGPFSLDMTPWWAVVMALALYVTAYVADNALQALQQWHQGSRGAALLFLMGLVRAFVVVVLSSGFGAAVGVVEATTVTLRALEGLTSLSHRLTLMALVTVLFMLVFQALYAGIDLVRARLLARWAPG